MAKVEKHQDIFKMSLQELPPEPVEIDDPPEDPYRPKKFLGLPIYAISHRSVIMGLRTIQKYSTIPMVAYFPLHAINTLVIPSISTDSAPDDVLMMIRELLPSFTTKLLVGSSIVHLTCGLILRVWKLWSTSASSFKRRRRRRRSHRKKEVSIHLEDTRERTSQRVIGLTGGLSGYFVGFNKSFNIPPQVLTGYILVPFLAYHLAIMKVIPNSSRIFVDIDFNFVKWIFKHEDWRIRIFGGFIPFSMLIWSGTYHIIAGTCQYLRIKDISKRRKWSNFITFLVGSGIFGIYRLSKIPNSILGSDRYEKIFRRLYML
ncbi:hypothetical protein HG535_0F05390 [Zygotorulaspora mrakii]|uniref:Mitochondrial adapter protein MCP1 transmembrane domain-containing protein n=1 Tax=Zygotorulaspora mrakii TaxID=42260 RepID=A0A7H9B635_ZYGMR|nr:uncharacterized protein HG535_0F05390 [Zygotorulaspora mrakii]QLG74027.1 hypothetical protein HG535_0F05390 [Zygotorulaspora mrakii]